MTTETTSTTPAVTTTSTFIPYEFTGPTKEDHLRGFEDWPEAARAARVRVTAKERHRARVTATKEAALKVTAGPEDKPGEPPSSVEDMLYHMKASHLMAAGLITLDLEGREHGPSARMEWASKLGTGRWRAHDGEAWAAAADEARRELMAEVKDTTKLTDEERLNWGVYPDGRLSPRGLARLGGDYLPPEQFPALVRKVARELESLTRWDATSNTFENDRQRAVEWVDALTSALRGEPITEDTRNELLRLGFESLLP